jgi:hypothetical protein
MRKLGQSGAAQFLFVAIFFGSSSFAAENKTLDKATPVRTAASPTSTPMKDLVLEINGEIYSAAQFPDNCGELLHGIKCDAKPVGRMHLESKKEGSEIYSKTTFSDFEMLQVTEQSWEENGHVKRVSTENNVLKKIFELEVKNGKVFYKITDKTDGSVKTSEEDADDNLVVPSTIVRYIGDKLGDLAAGKAVKVKVAAIDREESFTFTLRKFRIEKTPSGDPVLVLELKANSFFVRSVVDPMYLYFSKSGELVGFDGKSPLSLKVGDHYKDLIAKVGYQLVTDLLKPDFQLSPAECSDDVNNKSGMMKCEIPGAGTPTPAASSL